MHIDQATIVAISTPHGPGAIGIVRVSGNETKVIVQKHVDADLSQLKPNAAVFARFKIGDAVLDEVVLTYFEGPRSYTGEDVIELSFHGSSYVLSKALEAIMESGARLAVAGEFTQRAFFHGKLDLSQAEAVADLIASESEAEHRLAMHQMRGGFSKEIERLRTELIDFASLIELELDFAEEDVEFANRDELEALIVRINGFISKLIKSFQYGNAVKNGVPVAIIGKPNAGKSTLLNALLNEDKAIVSDIAGTTRDAIEDTTILDGIRFRFIDTAGIRETSDTIEAIGVERSYEKLKSASVVLYLYDVNEPWEDHENTVHEMDELTKSSGAHLILVGNKTDLSEVEPIASPHHPVIMLSAKQEVGIESLKSTLVASMENGLIQSSDVVVTNLRHLEALKATEQALNQSLTGLHNGFSGDLISADIREALHHLGSITGEITTDDLLGNIFGKFCIGK